MQRKHYLSATFVLAVIVIVGLLVWGYQRAATDPVAVYDTEEDAFNAGIAAGLPVTGTVPTPIFSYQIDGSTHYILPYIIQDSGSLSYAEAVYSLKTFPNGTGYSYELSPGNYAVYQEDENGNVVNDNYVATLTDAHSKITLLVGKSGEKTVIPDENHLLTTNLAKGAADNTWGIFVLVYQSAREPVPLPQVVPTKVLDSTPQTE